LIDTVYRRVGLLFLDFQFVGQDISLSLRVHWPLAELELVHVFFPAALGVEDGVAQVFDGLVASNLDRAETTGFFLANFSVIGPLSRKTSTV